jgi:hypothetical protein
VRWIRAAIRDETGNTFFWPSSKKNPLGVYRLEAAPTTRIIFSLPLWEQYARIRA